MAALCLLAIPLSHLLPTAVTLALPAATLLHKRKLAKHPPRQDRY